MAKINTAYTLSVSLTSQADTKLLQANPTLAANDVKISVDDGAFTNITTLPTVTPAGGKKVKVSLSAAEMNGSRIDVLFSDSAGAEWCDQMLSIETSPDDLTIANIAAAIIGPIWDRLTSAITTAGSIGKLIVDKITGLPEGLKKNTAFNNFEFEMTDAVTHLPKTGLTITSQRSIDGGAYAATTNAAVEVGNGTYKINFSAADLNGDFITFRFTGTGADETKVSIKTAA